MNRWYTYIWRQREKEGGSTDVSMAHIATSEDCGVAVLLHLDGPGECDGKFNLLKGTAGIRLCAETRLAQMQCISVDHEGMSMTVGRGGPVQC